MKITHASHLTNTELMAEVNRLAHGEREATVALIVHLAEFDSRRLYEGAGFSSLFKYCLEVLRLSEDAAYNRIETARAARSYPIILDMLATGALSPTTARLLARRLTGANSENLLAAAAGQSKQQVEELLARRFPQPDVPSSARRLPAPKGRLIRPITSMSTMSASGSPAGAESSGGLSAPPAGSDLQTSFPASTPAPRPLVRPLAPERYEIRFTASAETREKLRLAQDLLGHAVPSGDLAQIFDRALQLLLEDLARKKFAATKRPRRGRGQSENSRNVPAAVRRVVWVRDHGRCAFVARSGRRCNERRFLEFHHLRPYGVGGKATADNIQLRCRSHNRHEAELFYGPGRRYGGSDVAREPAPGYRCTTGRTRSGTTSRVASVSSLALNSNARAPQRPVSFEAGSS